MAEFLVTAVEMEKGRFFRVGETHVLTLTGVSRVRLIGMFFELNKCFLLPSAMPGIKGIKRQYDEHPDSKVLIVGHTDTSGQDAYNLELSVERADTLAAYFTDDVPAWEAFFGADKPSEKRWGVREVQHMLSALPEGQAPFFQGQVDGKDGPITQGAVRKFQESEGLKEDGIAGPQTRKALITRYMAIDGTTLPPGIVITTHGCGENFPVAKTQDAQRSPEDRRVEAFFFDGPITPPPPGKNSSKGSREYPQWVAQVTDTVDFNAEGSEENVQDCHLSFTLEKDEDGTPIAGALFRLDLGNGEIREGTTDSSGNMVAGAAAPGDYSLDVQGITMAVPALPKSESSRVLRLRPDLVQV